MRRFCKEHKCPLILISALLLLAAAALLLAQTAPGSPESNPATGTISNFRVEDAPGDEGSALVLKWDPMPKEAGIIEYRVYTGVSPDTLFMIGAVSINQKTGFTGTTVSYTDEGGDLCSIDSPRAFKRETKLGKDTPLFQELPRNLKTVAPLLKHYDVLARIPLKDMMKKGERVVKVDPAAQDTTVYAGYKLRDLGLIRQLRPNTDYYYAVVPVTSTRAYLPATQIVKGRALINAPANPALLAGTYCPDDKTLRLESSDPMSEIYLVRKNQLNRYNAFAAAMKEYNTRMEAALADTTLPKPQIGNPFPMVGTINYYRAEIKLEQGGIMDINTGQIFGFDPNRLDDYYFVAGNTGTAGMMGLAQNEDGTPGLANLKLLKAADKPQNMKELTVGDKPADKGDICTITWDEPVVYVSRLTFLNDHRLMVNYEVSNNPESPAYNIKKINFTFKSKDGNELAQVNEYYQDQQIKVSFPQNVNVRDGLTVETRISCNRPLPDNYLFTQSIIYSQDTMSMMPERNSKGLIAIMYNGEDIQDYSYILERKSWMGNSFMRDKKMSGATRYMDSTVRFLDDDSYMKYLPVDKLSDDRSMVLLDPGVDVGVVVDSLSILELKADRRALKGKLTALQTQIDTLKAAAALASMAEADSALTPATPVQNELLAAYQMLTGRLNLLNKQIREWQPKHIPIHTSMFASDKKDALKPFEMQIAALKAKIQKVGESESDKLKLTRLQGLEEAVKSDPSLASADKHNGNGSRARALFAMMKKATRSVTYRLIKADGAGNFIVSDPIKSVNGSEYFTPVANWFGVKFIPMLIITVVFGIIVFYMIAKAKSGADLFIRPIAGIQEIDNAIGRATEMGRPILFQPGLSGISDVATLAGLAILGRVAKKAAEYDTRLIVPLRDYIVLPIAQEIVREAHYEAGRPDTYNANDIFYITDAQFPFVAGVNGVMVREKTATNFYMGMFYAEALLMTETGNATGAIQIAGTDAVTQIPFFITTCDYTLIGEELYAASAYLAREPMMLGTLKGQDYTKFLILVFILIGSVLSTAHFNWLINAFPDK